MSAAIRERIRILAAPRLLTSSILSTVLEVNGVFNKKHPMYMTKKDFSQKAGVSAGTIKNKADAVKEILNMTEF